MNRTRSQLELKDLTTLVARARDHYVDQYRAFAKHQRAQFNGGGAEAIFQLDDQNELFSHLYRIDFGRNDDGALKVTELDPEYILTFEPIVGRIGNASLAIDHLRWDDVLIRHNLDELPSDQLSRWFQLWFDPDDARYDPNGELSEVIHSMFIYPHRINVDFGTAKPVAFWEILQLLDEAGAVHIEISSWRDDAENND